MPTRHFVFLFEICGTTPGRHPTGLVLHYIHKLYLGPIRGLPVWKKIHLGPHPPLLFKSAREFLAHVCTFFKICFEMREKYTPNSIIMGKTSNIGRRGPARGLHLRLGELKASCSIFWVKF